MTAPDPIVARRLTTMGITFQLNLNKTTNARLIPPLYSRKG